jgi:hypothetical protein
MKSTDRKITVDVSMVFGQTSENGETTRYAAVIIEDRASSMYLAEIRLDPAQLMKFMGGGNARVEVDWMSDEILLRIGKKMEHEQVTFPGSAFKDLADAKAGGESWRFKNGWESVEVRRNNKHEWVIVGRRWVAPDQES